MKKNEVRKISSYTLSEGYVSGIQANVVMIKFEKRKNEPYDAMGYYNIDSIKVKDKATIKPGARVKMYVSDADCTIRTWWFYTFNKNVEELKKIDEKKYHVYDEILEAQEISNYMEID